MISQMTNIPIAAELIAELEPIAKRFGMSVPAYIAFRMRVETHQLDREFVRAAKFVFSKYPKTLGKLAQ